MNRHPLSNLFSRFDLKDEDLGCLAEDIQEHGQILPITLHEGQILDGWNRFRACQLAGVKPRFVDLSPGVDPWEFVKGSNMLRRHMKPEERAVVMLLKFQMEGVPNGTDEGVPNGTPSVREIQKDLEVGKGTAERARRVAEAHDPALVDALADKRVSLDRAAELAKMPKEERLAALEAPRAPKPAPAPKPEASPEVDELKARIVALEEEKRELALLLKDTMEENASMQRILDAEDLRGQFQAEVKRFMELARVTEARNNGLIDEVNDLKGFCKMWKGNYERLAAANKAAGMEVPA